MVIFGPIVSSFLIIIIFDIISIWGCQNTSNVKAHHRFSFFYIWPQFRGQGDFCNYSRLFGITWVIYICKATFSDIVTFDLHLTCFTIIPIRPKYFDSWDIANSDWPLPNLFKVFGLIVDVCSIDIQTNHFKIAATFHFRKFDILTEFEFWWSQNTSNDTWWLDIITSSHFF